MRDQERQQSFDELKKRLASAETLGYFDKNANTKVIADASPVGLGAVLVQQQGEELRVISYASRSSDTEQRHSQTIVSMRKLGKRRLPLCGRVRDFMLIYMELNLSI